MKNLHDIAIIQMNSSTNKQENLQVSIEYIKKASKRNAKYIFFPEFQMAFSPSDQSLEELSDISESVDKQNGFVYKLQKQAKQNGINILATIYEKSQDNRDKRVYDSALFINENGEIKSVYRKLHLYDALGFKESAKFLSGDNLKEPVNTSIGKIGMMICYDIRFPEMSRILTALGSLILTVPSGWVHGVMKEDHWNTMLKARAIENGCYVIAPDQIGNIFSGRSMVVDPFGSVLCDMGNREGMEVVTIDIERINQVRRSLPLLQNRRVDIYDKNKNIFFKPCRIN